MLYGTIFGDIAGSIYEYKPVDKSYKFETITKKSHFTDDTTMTLAVASWLMKDKHDLDILIKEMQYFGQRYPQAGYGGTFRMWLIDPDPKPYNSWGNGSAMRVSPVGWIEEDLELTEEKAKWSAWVTHNHPEGIKGAQAVAAAIWMARNGKTKEEIKNYITEKYGYNLNRTIQEIKDSGYKFDVSCQGSVPESIIAFLESENFEDCIKKAIYLGGDADTQAAIAGSIAEAFYGFPEELKEIVESKLDSYLLSVLKTFNNFCDNE